MVKRYNVLDLLGSDKRKYRSCIITCFSFDFIFFEQRVLPKLRQAGIININIYVDAYQFDKQISHFTGSDLLESKAGYSVTPVKMTGAFHPKILMAFGKTKGFLAVGSGNLTSSGLSSNEEIWGSFHLTETDKSTQPIFKEVSEYLKKFEEFVSGTNILKLGWIKENSEWYKNLLEETLTNKLITDKDQIFEIVSTYQNESIYKSLIARLPKNPRSIKILSPYYNTNGSFLNTIIQDFQPENIHCIVDPIFGSIPYKLDKNTKIEYSDWNKIEKAEKYCKNRLHAKAIQFDYDNETYFLFGSANATREAFGISANESVNAEMSILVRSNKPRNYFKELGINFPKRGVYKLEEYELSNQIHQKEGIQTEFLVFIKNAEIDGNELTVYLENNFAEKVDLKIEDANGLLIYNQSINSLKKETVFSIENQAVLKPFRASIYRLTVRISNYALIHHKSLLLPTNPDERRAQLNSFLSFDDFGDFELQELFEFIFLSSDFTNSNNVSRNIAGKVKNEMEEVVDTISEEEFNKNSSNLIETENFNHYSTSRIEEFLNSLNFENNSAEQIIESTEDAALAAGLDGLTGEPESVESVRREVTFEVGLRITYKIERTIEKIIKSILPQKSNHLKILNNKESEGLANLHQLNALLIGFHIILKKRSEVYSEDRSTIRLRYDDINELINIENKYLLIKKESQAGNLKNEINFSINFKKVNQILEDLKPNKFVKIIYADETATQKINHPYFSNKFWTNEFETKSIISFLRNGLSTYLLMLTKQVDIKDEKDNLLWLEKNKRLKLLSICSILNYHWTSAHYHTKVLLLLNIFYYLGANEDFETFEKEVEFYIGKLNLGSFITDERFFELIDLYTDYLSWFQQYKKDVKSLKSELNRFSENEIIFHHCYGFAKVNHFYSDKTVNLESPLGAYNVEKGIYGFENIFIGFTPVFFLRYEMNN